STASMTGMSMLVLVLVLVEPEGLDASAVGAGLVLVFWAKAAPAGRATLMRHAVATMPRRRRVVVLNSMMILPLCRRNLSHRRCGFNSKWREQAGSVGGGQHFDLLTLARL